MNKSILMGRLTRDPDVRYADNKAYARFTIAVDRRVKQETGQNADFIQCVAFGKTAEFIEKYIQKGTKILVTGHIQTGSYTDRDGKKVYTTDVICEEVEFAESKAQQEPKEQPTPTQTDPNGFMSIPDGIGDELPFA